MSANIKKESILKVMWLIKKMWLLLGGMIDEFNYITI